MDELDQLSIMTPSLSSSSIPSSHSDSSGVNPMERSVLAVSTNTNTFDSAKRTLFKMDLSTLLRSTSTSSKAGKRHPVVLSNGTGEEMEPEDPERPARRKSKSDRFYSFLTRSRSRSSKRTAASTSIFEESPDIPQNTIHSRNSSWSSARSEKRPISSTTVTRSKPSNIIQSRPISTTTTATNTTITPPTPKAHRPPASLIPKPTELPKSPTRKRLHNIFRRSSTSSSRATSPAPDDLDEEVTPKRNHPLSRLESPSPQFSHSRQSSSELHCSTTVNSASKLENLFKPSKFFTSSRRASSPPPLLSLSRSGSIGSPMPTPSSSNSGFSNAPIVSGPSKHVSTSRIARRRASTNESISSSSSIQRTAHVAAPQPRPAQFLPTPVEHITTSQPVPRITHTAVTPTRSGTAPPRLSQSQPRKDSMDSGYRYRPLVMVDEERDSKEIDVKGKGKEGDIDAASRSKESDHSSVSGHKSASTNHHHSSNRHAPIKSKTSNLTNIRSTKHGSFDFERPGWGLGGGGAIVRSMSGTSGNSGATGFSGGKYSSRSGESVGSAPRSNEESTRQKKGTNVRISLKREEARSQRRDVARNDDPVPPYSPSPASTTTTTGQGLSSSLGRSAGKRTGIARFIGVGGTSSHGAFAFEPPVPSPTLSQASQERAKKETNAEKDRERRRREKERERKEKESAEEKQKTQIKDRNRRSEQDNFGFSGVSSKPGRKGRSLDLGIGLSWASTKVPESVLLPGGMFGNTKGLNGRISQSTSSRSYADRERAADEFGVEDRSKVGKDVANIFKKALDPEGYSAFKKYVHQFDAHEIPFDGPNGIIARTQKLLDKRTDLEEESKRKVIDRLVKIVLQNA